MQKITLILTLPWLLVAGYTAHISPITSEIKSRMLRGHSWHRGCPVPLANLRYLRMTYRGFDGRDHSGEMVVHANVANEVTQIFGELYRNKYPIRKMELVSRYGGNDFKSIEADNTSAFNCRKATGSRNWSKHSFGKAIDINPIENPYITNKGHIYHKKSYKFRVRKHKNLNHNADKAMLIRGDKAVKIFTKKGWRWGATFREARDLQHFHKL